MALPPPKRVQMGAFYRVLRPMELSAGMRYTTTHWGQQLSPALTLPQVRYGLGVLLLEMFCTPGIDDICRQVSRQ